MDCRQVTARPGTVGKQRRLNGVPGGTSGSPRFNLRGQITGVIPLLQHHGNGISSGMFLDSGK
ncbi:MAG: hypothetical protein JW863_00645 [Chitinispirillaceae bacterium]|nr:hypothetical protein [Chitinispirillaceae bacterium]